MFLESPNAKSVLRVDVDPSQFPKIPGYAYLMDRTGKGRSAPLRGFYLRDEVRDYWAAQITWRGLDEGAAGTIGAAYLGRHDKAAANKEAMAAKIAALHKGERTTATVAAPAAAAAAPVATIRPAVPMPVISTENVIAFPSWPPKVRPAVPQEPTAQETVAPILMTERGRKLYDLVRSGVRQFGELQDRGGYGETHTRNTLKALMNAGLITDSGRGKWTVREADQDVDEEADQVA